VEQMGGPDAVVLAAQKAYDKQDYQWAAELLTYVIRVNREDGAARKLKAAALRQLAYKTENTNWRDWYISSARELEKSLNPIVMTAAMGGLAPPDVLKALPVVKFFESMSVRLDPVKSAGAHVVVIFRFTDSGRACAVEVRHGVAQIHESLPAQSDITLDLTTD